MEEGRKKGKGGRENRVYFIKNLSLNLFLEIKALPTTFLPSVKTLTKNILFFSFSTGFLFCKKKKCKESFTKENYTLPTTIYSKDPSVL